ncbi:MAG TPA: alpha/beta hydrolase [Chthoniobacterales bacterium]|jgi:predicted esterase
MSASFIHRFVPGENNSPVLLLLHGTGGNENDLLNLGHSLLPEAALLSPRGKILENGMPRFFRRLSEGVFDEPDLILRTHELAEFLTWAQAEYSLEGRPVVAVGYSNGANIAASLFLLRPEILAGAILLRAMVPLQPETLPALNGRSIFLAAGQHDPIIPPDNTERLAVLLKQAGANVELHWTAGGHELHTEEIAVAKRWLTSRFSANL